MDPANALTEGAAVLELTDAAPQRRRMPRTGRSEASASLHSHSMVPGGFEVTSSTTRLTSRTSLVMRFEMRASTS